MTDSIADDLLRNGYDRWLRLEEAKAEVSDDIKELMAELKAAGFTPKALRESFRRVRNIGDADQQEHDAIVDLYVASLTRARPAPAHEKTLNNSRSYAEEKGSADTIGNSDPISISEIAEHEQPETATRRLDDLGSVQDGLKMSSDGQPAEGLGNSDSQTLGEEKACVTAGETATHSHSHRPPAHADMVEASTDKQAAGTSRPAFSSSAAHSPAERAGEAPSSNPTSPATLSDMPISTTPSFAGRVTGDMPDIPDFLRRTGPKAREWEDA